MELKSNLMDEAQLFRSLARVSHEIIEKNNGSEKLCLIGIKRRGVPLANMIRDNIRNFAGIELPVGEIDITLYRDDLTELAEEPKASGSAIPCEPRDYTMILVDDVLFTGRTARAAIDAVLHFGRPKAVQLAVLIDRGHRELPIRPDYVGKNIPTARDEVVRVSVMPIDETNRVELLQ